MALKLSEVLESMCCPKTVRITEGHIVSEEGLEIGVNDTLTLISGGFKVYMTPNEFALLRERLDTRNSGSKSHPHGDENYTNVQHYVGKKLFVAAKSNLRDNYFEGKVYTDPETILRDLPKLVRVNHQVFALREVGDHCERIVVNENEILKIEQDPGEKSKTLLRCRVSGEKVAVPMSKESFNVTAVSLETQNDTIFSGEKVLEIGFRFPKEVTFVDEDIQLSFQIEVGCTVVALDERPRYSLCCFLHNDSLQNKWKISTERLDFNIHLLRNARCVDIDEETVKAISVEVVEEFPISMFRPAFAKLAENDSNGYNLFHVFGRLEQEPLESSFAVLEQEDKYSDYSITCIHDRTRQSEERPPLPGTWKCNTNSAYDNLFGSTGSSPVALATETEANKFIQKQSNGPPIPRRDCSTFDTVQCETGEDSDDDYVAFCPENHQVEGEERGAPRDNRVGREDDGSKEKELKSMSVSELAQFFHYFKLSALADICDEYIVDGCLFQSLEESDLREKPFNLKGFELKRVLLLLKGHRPKR